MPQNGPRLKPCHSNQNFTDRLKKYWGLFLCPSFPWCFGFLDISLAVDFLGVWGCFLLILQGLSVRRVSKSLDVFVGFPWLLKKNQGKKGQGWDVGNCYRCRLQSG